MKYWMAFTVSLLFFIQSCKKERFYSSDAFHRSYKTWLDFKAASNNSYTYTQTWSSWTGFSSSMVVQVNNGKVTGRTYKSMGPDEQDRTKIKLYAEWTETNETLNTHKGYDASLTLDEIYDKAKHVWLRMDEDENLIFFEANNKGMISTCGYFPKNCADDCFTGVTITEIKD